MKTETAHDMDRGGDLSGGSRRYLDSGMRDFHTAMS